MSRPVNRSESASPSIFAAMASVRVAPRSFCANVNCFTRLQPTLGVAFPTLLRT
jgi:hypothetical protein